MVWTLQTVNAVWEELGEALREVDTVTIAKMMQLRMSMKNWMLVDFNN